MTSFYAPVENGSHTCVDGFVVRVQSGIATPPMQYVDELIAAGFVRIKDAVDVAAVAVEKPKPAAKKATRSQK